MVHTSSTRCCWFSISIYTKSFCEIIFGGFQHHATMAAPLLHRAALAAVVAARAAVLEVEKRAFSPGCGREKKRKKSAPQAP